MARKRQASRDYRKNHRYGSKAWDELSPDQRREVRMIDAGNALLGCDTTRPNKRSFGVQPVAFARCGRCASTDVAWVRLSETPMFEAIKPFVHTAAERERAARIGAKCIRQCQVCNEWKDIRAAKPLEVEVAAPVRGTFGAGVYADDRAEQLRAKVRYKTAGGLLKFAVRDY